VYWRRWGSHVQAEPAKVDRPVAGGWSIWAKDSMQDIPSVGAIMATLSALEETRGAGRRYDSRSLIDDHLQAMAVGFIEGAHEHLSRVSKERIDLANSPDVMPKVLIGDK